MKHSIVVLISLIFAGCASPRSHSIFALRFSDQPAKAQIRSLCNDQRFTTEGVVVCEQKAPSEAQVLVKVPPLEGRAIYSNGQLKKTDDFNWHPKQGFWIFKKKPLKDTWLPLDLGEIKDEFGDWPVAIDVTAIHPDIGAINTRGVLYHRICNDQDIPCSKLVVKYQCSGRERATSPDHIGKCVRMAGSSHAFSIPTKTEHYAVGNGGMLYIKIPRLGVAEAIKADKEEIQFETPEIPPGPTLVGFRMVWYEGKERKSAETRVLIFGADPAWTGIDQPHRVVKDDRIEWYKPVLADVMEVNLYDRLGNLKEGGKKFTSDKMIETDMPKGTDIVCAFAWHRESSDLTASCIDGPRRDVEVP